MRALTLKPAWAWAVLFAGKRLENRTWSNVPAYMIGQTFLVHASSASTRADYAEAALFMQDAGLAVPAGSRILRERPGALVIPRMEDLQCGAVVGRARLAGAIRNARDFASYAAKTPNGEAQRAWWSGSFALVLADVEPFQLPIPCKGRLGFWEAPGPIVAESNRQYGEGCMLHAPQNVGALSAVNAALVTTRRPRRSPLAVKTTEKGRAS